MNRRLVLDVLICLISRGLVGGLVGSIGGDMVFVIFSVG